MIRVSLIAAAALAALWTTAAPAQELKIGLSAEPSAMDPHFHNLTPNNSLLKHIYDRLITQDENQKLTPGLALSWKSVDPTTWEFKLRPNVKFTDGSDFTANDVIYTFCRVPKVENSPSSFVINVRSVVGMSAPHPHTRILKTAQSHPLLPNEVSNVAVLSAKANGAGQVEFDRTDCKNAGTYPKTEAFNSGQAAIGTGPYKLVQFTK
ncbi:MAG: ABC transporter substrate-binding protein, partial [Rhizobiales bacterium]|nr:ABC transporter substrate-binding protein [Hyphomicrobiales bacterium]